MQRSRNFIKTPASLFTSIKYEKQVFVKAFAYKRSGLNVTLTTLWSRY